MFDFFKNRRREALRQQPLSFEERAVLDRNIPYLSRLSAEDRTELEGLVRIFVSEKSFEGCGGLSLTDEIKLTIAGQACLLLLHRETDIYPNVEAILVYPSAYRVPTEQHDGLVVVQEDQARLGESWQRGLVVLAWDHVLSGAAQPRDGQNVVLHEFAHQLDSEDGVMNGTPDLGARARYTSWAPRIGRRVRGAVATPACGARQRHRSVRCHQSRRILRRPDRDVLRETAGTQTPTRRALRGAGRVLQARSGAGLNGRQPGAGWN